MKCKRSGKKYQYYAIIHVKMLNSSKFIKRQPPEWMKSTADNMLSIRHIKVWK